MNQLSGEEVLSYGTDDTICTAALYNHFRLRTEIEGTWGLINEIEIKPAYLTAYAFTQGTKFSLERMNQLEKADAQAYEKAWDKVREFLISCGWEGTKTPVYEGDLTPAQIKEIVQILLGQELKTMVRTPSKLAKLVEVLDHDDAPLLAQYLTNGDIQQINDWVKGSFSGEPKFDLNSPKQMKHLLYTVLGLPVRLVNSCTPTEREKKPELARAIQRFKRIANGSQTEAPLTDEEKELIKPHRQPKHGVQQMLHLSG
jgi:virulence-associated protein VapD